MATSYRPQRFGRTLRQLHRSRRSSRSSRNLAGPASRLLRLHRKHRRLSRSRPPHPRRRAPRRQHHLHLYQRSRLPLHDPQSGVQAQHAQQLHPHPADHRWSRLSGAQQISELVGIIDLAPTILEAAGLTVPPSWKGRSVLPLLDRSGVADRPGRTSNSSRSANP